MTNQKYEITDIVHGEYPFLHRVRALRDIGTNVKAGDLGGFVEHEGNLSFEPGDDAWVCDEAIAAGDSVVEKGSVLRGRAVVCGSACVSHGSVLFGDARAEAVRQLLCVRKSPGRCASAGQRRGHQRRGGVQHHPGRPNPGWENADGGALLCPGCASPPPAGGDGGKEKIKA